MAQKSSSEPIRPRAAKVVCCLRTRPQEKTLHTIIRAAGGIRESKRQPWRLSSRVATILNLANLLVGV
jgi:hypothetical protein